MRVWLFLDGLRVLAFLIFGVLCCGCAGIAGAWRPSGQDDGDPFGPRSRVFDGSGSYSLAQFTDVLETYYGIRVYAVGVDWATVIDVPPAMDISDVPALLSRSGPWYVLSSSETLVRMVGCVDDRFFVPAAWLPDGFSGAVEGITPVGEGSSRVLMGPCESLRELSAFSSVVRASQGMVELRFLIVDDDHLASVRSARDIAGSSWSFDFDFGSVVYQYSSLVTVGSKVDFADETENLLTLTTSSGESDVVFNQRLERVQAGFIVRGELLEAWDAWLRLRGELEISTFSGEDSKAIRRASIDLELHRGSPVRLLRFWVSRRRAGFGASPDVWNLYGSSGAREFSVFVVAS